MAWTYIATYLHKISKYKKKSNLFLKKIFNYFGTKKKYHIVFCLEEIDIRTSFYRLLKLGKSYNNLENLLTDYSSGMRNSITEINKILSKDLDIKFYFKDPTPTTSDNGYLPINMNELKNIFKTKDFPVLGNISDRIFWNVNLKKKIIENIDLFTFLENNKECYNAQGTISNKVSDNIHITSEKIISDFQNNLILINEK